MNVINGNLKNRGYEHIKKAMHDIRSPLACLKMLNMVLTNLSEKDKILLCNSTQRITRIVDSLDSILNQSEIIKQRKNESINVNLIIEKILIEKKNEYYDRDITFNYSVQESSKSALISGSICDFERMLSNMINNAVDACEGKSGRINLDLYSDNSYLYLIISDNGKGIPDEVLDKLRNNILVTHGKDSGHGLGFMQIGDTVKQLEGKFTIDSKVGVGSKLSLKIKLNKGCFK